MSATSAVLTGLSLATGISREATDAVPVVKQVLGIALRIVGLAEQVDKNREDLHALADRAKSMDATITDIIGDRELLRRLEDMNRVLRTVEKHFDKHLKQGRVRKTLRYIFTVRKEVDRLRGEFDDRLKELEVAATLDSSITAKRNARFTGKFRTIRHSEIDLLRRITPQGYKINCHLATCEGSNQLVVVRAIAEYGHDEEARQRIEENDSILERLSLVKNRHPNIAYIYGRNTGTEDSRFVVLKAGDIRSIDDAFGGRGAEFSVISRIITKLADAMCHLQRHGADCMLFDGEEPSIYLDKNYEPKIGIQDDFRTLHSGAEYHAWIIKQQMKLIFGGYSALQNSLALSLRPDTADSVKKPFFDGLTSGKPGVPSSCSESSGKILELIN